MVKANYRGKCAGCGEPFDEGEDIEYSEDNAGWVVSEHEDCIDEVLDDDDEWDEDDSDDEITGWKE